MRRQEPIDQRLQPVRLADDHLRVFDQRRAIQLALEKLRGAADAAERILDLVGETPNELAVRLLLFEQSFLIGAAGVKGNFPPLSIQTLIAIRKMERAITG